MKLPDRSATRETITEGAAEVKAKLREDLSRWSRTRRFATLKPEIPCLECDGAGKIQCAACGGTGLSKLVLDDGRQEACVKCDGKGAITCVVCAGKGLVANAHRKTMLWLLAVGGLAWLFILFQLWGRDVLPEQRAAILQRGEHGQAVTAPAVGVQGAGRGVTAPVQGGAGVSPGGPASTAWPQPGQPQTPVGAQGSYGAPPLQPGVTTPSGMPHGNSVQPGTNPSGGIGYGQPQGGARPGPYGGGNSLGMPPGR